MQYEATANDVQLGSQPRNIPYNLTETYWWAYVHPGAVRVFERQWLVNLILWGNFALLRDAALDELGPVVQGRTLQVACVYGDFSVRLAERVGPGGSLHVVDVLPIQLQNLRRKLPVSAPVRLLQRDSRALGLADASYDQAILFFLLHEQPAAVRKQTVAEAVRVVRPGGKIVVVDYHQPRKMHPLRYILPPMLRALEPYALDLWDDDRIDKCLADLNVRSAQRKTFYGGLYQKLVIAV
jgi:ubiquinone/menaquinone biosynthesis C-methylase UbiE